MKEIKKDYQEENDSETIITYLPIVAICVALVFVLILLVTSI